MKNLFVLFALLSIVVSCNQETKKTADAEPVKEEEIATKAVTVAEVLASPETYTGSEVKITGMVTHVCSHGGQKLFIINEDPEQQLRISVGEGIPEFDKALEGSKVEFTGLVKILEADVSAALAIENEEKDHHTGDEAHAEAESASYFIEATAFKELETEAI